MRALWERGKRNSESSMMRLLNGIRPHITSCDTCFLNLSYTYFTVGVIGWYQMSSRFNRVWSLSLASRRGGVNLSGFVLSRSPLKVGLLSGVVLLCLAFTRISLTEHDDVQERASADSYGA